MAQAQDARPVRAEDYKHPVRVACVGDSITYGAGVEGRQSNSYPAVLGRMLGSKFVVKNLGVSGATLLKQGDKPYWTTPDFSKVTNDAPDVIVIKLGTNDSKPQNWGKHAAEFENDLRAMLEVFGQLPSKPRLWLCLPVPVYDTRRGINEPIVAGEIIPIIQKVAHEKNLPIINLHEALKDKPDLFPDKVHPNAAGARLMARAVYSALIGHASAE
ncbi:MAG TPA: GDSL-type esterase/lipase family protein [Verrucomicrobiae bacterium]